MLNMTEQWYTEYMRKLCSIMILLFCLCGCVSNSSEAVVRSYLDCMHDGNVEKAHTYLSKDLYAHEESLKEMAQSSGLDTEVQKYFIHYMKHIIGLQWDSYQIQKVSHTYIEVEIEGIAASDLEAIDTHAETEILQQDLQNGENENKAFKRFYQDSQKKVDALQKKKRTVIFTINNNQITAINQK